MSVLENNRFVETIFMKSNLLLVNVCITSLCNDTFMHITFSLTRACKQISVLLKFFLRKVVFSN